jgi:uncharacterized protein (TIGR02118 family)
MIRLSVFYPAGEGRTFDMNYYLNSHIPMFRKRMGAALRDIRVEQGTSGPTRGSAATFVAMVHSTFDSMEAFESAFGPHAAEVQGDIPKYTNIEPILQFSEVKL